VATPWDLPSLRLFQVLGVGQYKINSLNAFNVPLVSEVLAAGTRTYLSTGGLSEAEIETLCGRLRLGEYNLVLLHAVTAYPAPASVLNMRALDVLRRYHSAVGYASNDLSDTAVLAAVALGATVVDKHVHLFDSVDDVHKGSITAERFAQLIRDIRELETVLGRPSRQESRGEMVNQDLLAKGLVLAEDVPAGTTLSASNLTMRLPPRGMTARRWFDAVGSRAARDLKAGDYLFSTDLVTPVADDSLDGWATPGSRGVVVRLKDIDEMVAGREYDYVEVHYAAGDLEQPDVCPDYDLDLVVHMPEYASGVLLDLVSFDEALRRFSIEVMNRVMAKTRAIRRHFLKCQGDVKFVLHPGALTYPGRLPDAERQYDLFRDSLSRLDTSGIEVLVENMTPYPWFLAGDWSPKQGVSNSFLDPERIAAFLSEHGYRMCLDLCHAQLHCTRTGTSLLDYMRTVRPHVGHIHFSDATGVDGEGLQVGDGDVDWRHVCEVFADYEHGWTPEIWNGHHDHGAMFWAAHRRLASRFAEFRNVGSTRTEVPG
jgi:N-acetylneuraminate synthase